MRPGISTAEVEFRDSIALRESYQAATWRSCSPGSSTTSSSSSASPSWPHDEALIRVLHRAVPRSRIVIAGPIASKGKELLERLPVHA